MDRAFRSPRRDAPDVDEKDVPVGLAAGRPVEAARDVDVIPGLEDMEGIGPVGRIVDGEPGCAG